VTADPPAPPAGLPRRVAEVTHALVEMQAITPGKPPMTATEICDYDAETASLDDTIQALAQACEHGLAVSVGHRWIPTPRAWQLRGELEEWFYAT
jgi:hypothetical protein